MPYKESIAQMSACGMTAWQWQKRFLLVPAIVVQLMLVLLAICLTPQPAAATDCAATTCRYVRAGGTGSGSGLDWSNACAEFTGSCAVSSLIRGATYFVAGGSYAARTWNRSASGSSTITIKKAIVADHGTDTGWSDGFAAQAVFNGQHDVTTPYWIFDGQVGDYLAGGIDSYGFKFTFSDRIGGGQIAFAIEPGADNVTGRYIDFSGPETTDTYDFTGQAKAWYPSGGNNWILSHSALHGGESLIQGGGNNWVVEYSYLYQARSTSANFHNNVFYASGMNGGVFRYNRIWDYNDEGLFFTGYNGAVSNIKVYGNLFYSDGTPHYPRGIEMRQDYGYTNIEIYNNTFSRLSVGGIFNRSPETGHTCSGCVARDNLSYQAGNTLTGMIQDNNTDDNTNRFTNLAANDFTLSAALPGAFLADEYNRDMNGNLRGASGAWDRGALVFGTSSGTLGAPTNLRIIR